MVSYTFKPLFLACYASLFIHSVVGAAVTFYQLSETVPVRPVTRVAGHSATVTPISTAADGMTVYRAVEAVTERVVEWTAWETTETDVATPTTTTWTFRADATRDQFGPYTTSSMEDGRSVNFVVSYNCTNQGDGTMECAERVVVESGSEIGQPTTATVDFTRTGAAVPWYTLTGTNAGSSRRGMPGWGCGALMAGLHALGIGLGVLLV